jgi:phosphohistidine swiveling domain-containing protein
MVRKLITTGRTVYPGSASGTVRTAEKEELEPLGSCESLEDRFSEGDILLVYKMYPSLVSLGRKADAVLTHRDGGLTSSEAVFSRETDTPCVVDLESTSDINDGDSIVVETDDSVDEEDERTGEIFAQ